MKAICIEKNGNHNEQIVLNRNFYYTYVEGNKIL